MLKNPDGSLLSDFSALWDCWEFSFFFWIFFSTLASIFWNFATKWIFKKVPLLQFSALWNFSNRIIFVLKLGFLRPSTLYPIFVFLKDRCFFYATFLGVGKKFRLLMQSCCFFCFFSPDLFMKISNFSKTVHRIFTKFCTVILHPKGPLRVQRHQNRMAGMWETQPKLAQKWPKNSHFSTFFDFLTYCSYVSNESESEGKT